MRGKRNEEVENIDHQEWEERGRRGLEGETREGAGPLMEVEQEEEEEKGWTSERRLSHYKRERESKKNEGHFWKSRISA